MKFSLLLSAFLAAVALSPAMPARAETAVDSYAQTTIDKGVALLKDPTLTGQARHDALMNFLRDTLDIKRIALFTLGPDSVSAPPAAVSDYEKAFEDFVLAKYLSYIGAYGGQSLKITSAVERAPGDYILGVMVVDPTAEGDPATANFRMLKEGDGKFAVVDANIEGVWFGLAERDDIQGFLQQNGHDLTKLIAYLQQMTKDLNAPPGS
jgi:ABC-type transporter MlaC component